MIRFILILLLIGVGGWWLVDTVLSHPGQTTITWGGADGQFVYLIPARPRLPGAERMVSSSR